MLLALQSRTFTPRPAPAVQIAIVCSAAEFRLEKVKPALRRLRLFAELKRSHSDARVAADELRAQVRSSVRACYDERALIMPHTLRVDPRVRVGHGQGPRGGARRALV